MFGFKRFLAYCVLAVGVLASPTWGAALTWQNIPEVTPADQAGASTQISYLRANEVGFLYSTLAADTEPSSLSVGACTGGVRLELHQDIGGTVSTCTATLHSCFQTEPQADFANDCNPLNFDPDGGGANTNVLVDDATADRRILYGVLLRHLGVEITNTNPDQCMVAAWCLE